MLPKVDAGHGVEVPTSLPAPHQKPCGHVVVALAPAGQKDPAGHVRHEDDPAVGWYVPAVHGTGAALPPAHRLPAGQSVVATASPPAHTKPASHGREGVTVPELGHVKPALHARQPASDVSPVALPKVPGGHGTGTLLLATQYDPSGHT